MTLQSDAIRKNIAKGRKARKIRDADAAAARRLRTRRAS